MIDFAKRDIEKSFRETRTVIWLQKGDLKHGEFGVDGQRGRGYVNLHT